MNTILQKKPELNLSKLEENIALAGYTTFGVGGNADYFCAVKSREDLSALLKWCDGFNISFLTIGGGSNLLISDKGFKGLVIKLEGGFKEINRNDERLTAGAGVSLPVLWERARSYSLGGWEHLAGIPGTVGGAVVVNAGTRYGAIGDIVSKLTLMDGQGMRALPKENLEFSYRASNIDPQREIVVEVEFFLLKEETEQIDSEMKKYMAERKINQPLNLKSAGCIFKNPPDGPASKFIDDAGLKGLSKGDAEVSKLHANFIVNNGKATASDILYLVRAIQDKVYKKFGVSLEPEIKIV